MSLKKMVLSFALQLFVFCPVFAKGGHSSGGYKYSGSSHSSYSYKSPSSGSSYKSHYRAPSSPQIKMPKIESPKSDVTVKSYYKKDGTYVPSHYRTNPDSTKNNNWSTSFNVNPHTGAEGNSDGGSNKVKTSRVNKNFETPKSNERELNNPTISMKPPKDSNFTSYSSPQIKSRIPEIKANNSARVSAKTLSPYDFSKQIKKPKVNTPKIDDRISLNFSKVMNDKSTISGFPKSRIFGIERDSKGRITRHSAARVAFMRETGYPEGRPGYVIDHITPLKTGGADSPSNMQWQTIEEAKTKDKWE